MPRSSDLDLTAKFLEWNEMKISGSICMESGHFHDQDFLLLSSILRNWVIGWWHWKLPHSGWAPNLVFKRSCKGMKYLLHEVVQLDGWSFSNPSSKLKTRLCLEAWFLKLWKTVHGFYFAVGKVPVGKTFVINESLRFCGRIKKHAYIYIYWEIYCRLVSIEERNKPKLSWDLVLSSFKHI